MSAGRKRRPFSVWLLAVFTFVIGLLNILRLSLALQQWSYLRELLPFNPAYLALSGLVWGGAGLLLGSGLWLGRKWARRGALPVFALYSLYTWADRLLLPGYPYRNVDWPFWLVVNILILVWSAWVLSRNGVKEYFGGNDEHKRQDPNPAPTT